MHESKYYFCECMTIMKVLRKDDYNGSPKKGYQKVTLFTLVSPGEIHLYGPLFSSSGCVE